MSLQIQKNKVAIIGLGYVGLPLAVELGKVRQVLGFDINESRISELQSGTDRTHELHTEDLLASHGLEYSSDVNLLSNCQIFIITVPTPIDSANRPDLKPLIKASEMVGKAL